MPVEFTIRPVAYIDKLAVIDIFNHYVENTFAAYPLSKVPYEFFDMLMDMAKGYPFYVAETSADDKGTRKVIGYGLLRPHYRMGTFARTAELTCFISPDFTGMGIGRKLLDTLVTDAKSMDIDTILASISSANPGSITFHSRYGFSKCGEFIGVGKKFDRTFNEVWMQFSIK